MEPTTMLFMGNLDSRVDRRLLYEIGVQAGRVAAVNVPIDPIFNKNKGYGFIDYETVEMAMYAMELFSNNLRLFGKEVRVSYSPKGRSS